MIDHPPEIKFAAKPPLKAEKEGADETLGKEVGCACARLFGRTGAIIAGLVLMVAGVGMGVSIVLLPLGLPIGLVGLLLFLGGVFGWSFLV